MIKDKSYIVYENVKTQLTCTAIGGYPYPEVSIAFGSNNARTPAVITMLYHAWRNMLHIEMKILEIWQFIQRTDD